ncbi:DUF1292 domain-containing protein [Paenibacillus sp. HB172176]|uniref:DUF1292 domain-containing protein n=1 Tax=Paenibacillus sp. HB172176 TaxID=2493690 RepID=UPI00143ABE96|nr:DUF1292 domain-containing protein [Paenibacillus sp. HB172176]
MSSEFSGGLSLLKEAFGQEVELVSDEGIAEPYRIMAEFRWNGMNYAALQNAAMKAEDEIAFMRIILDDGEPQLETIEDEVEWEFVAEAYDDSFFAGDERP